MSYGDTVRATARTGRSNLVGISVASVAITLTAVPFLATLALGAVPAAIGGLWTTCLLFGLTLVGLFRFVTTAADRGVAVSALPHLTASVRQPWTGVGLGAITFVVVLSTLAAGIAPDGMRATALGVAGFLLVWWYLVVSFAAPELGNGASLPTALHAGIKRFARFPVAAVWFLLLSVICTVVAGVTVVTLVLFLPGVLGLLAVHVVDEVASGPSEND